MTAPFAYEEGVCTRSLKRTACDRAVRWSLPWLTESPEGLWSKRPHDAPPRAHTSCDGLVRWSRPWLPRSRSACGAGVGAALRARTARDGAVRWSLTWLPQFPEGVWGRRLRAHTARDEAFGWSLSWLPLSRKACGAGVRKTLHARTACDGAVLRFLRRREAGDQELFSLPSRSVGYRYLYSIAKELAKLENLRWAVVIRFSCIRFLMM